MEKVTRFYSLSHSLFASEASVDTSRLNSSVVMFMRGEWRFAPGASVTIKSGAQLVVTASHLYSCDNEMWPGIVVEDGGKVFMNASQSDNLVEDALIALDCSNQLTTTVGAVLDISNTTFNRNYTAIKITNYDGSSNFYANPLSLENCVFTSRSLPFSSTEWPRTGTSNTSSTFSFDLRVAASATTGYSSPYFQPTLTVTNLKPPYNTQPSHQAILLEYVGSVATGSFTGVQIGSSGNFNLFDSHGQCVSAMNSNVTLVDNVFQNTQRYTALLNPGALIQMYGLLGGEAVYAWSNNVQNCAVIVGGTQSSSGNRFWDCHTAINSYNIWSADIQNNIFRSSQTTSVLPIGQTIHGHKGIAMSTNRYQYWIRYNEFTNIHSCIDVGVAPGQYTTTATGTVVNNGMLATCVGVLQNTFSAGPSSGQYLGNAFDMYAFSTWTPVIGTYTNVSPPISGIYVGNNEVSNAFRGFHISGFSGPQVEVTNNNVQLRNDNVFNSSQYGVKLTNCTPKTSLGYLNTIHQNSVVGSGTTTPNPNESLFYLGMNKGINTPSVCCNEGELGHSAFTFESDNSDAVWAGNVMKPMIRGLVLTQTAIIGPQGNNGTSSHNTWADTWQANTHHGTYAGMGSIAGNSPLWCANAGMYPQNNIGDVGWGQQFWYSAFGNPNIFTSLGGDYNCIGIPNNITIPIPDYEQFESATPFSIYQNLLYRTVHLDPGLDDPGGDLTNFHGSLSSSKAKHFMDVEQKLNIGDYTSARTINNAIDVDETDNCEVTYQEFYRLYANHQEAVVDETAFSEADSIALRALAMLCPGANGPAVYQAQALFRYIYPGYTDFGNCESGIDERRGRKDDVHPGNETLKQWDVSIYPNPAQDYIELRTATKQIDLQIAITDISGRVIFNFKLRINTGRQTLPVELNNGLYFVTISSIGHDQIVQKLVISK